MRITDIRIKFSTNPSSKVRAFASIVIDEILIIHGFRIVEGVKGIFVGFPCQKSQDGKFFDSVQPVSSTAEEFLKNSILRAYEDELARPERKSGLKKAPEVNF